MDNSEKFCLRWNDFENNISQAFREIREEKDFFDCTLSCGARQIQAHKLILSACSPFFRSVLKQNPHQHPLLYLKGVAFSDLQAVLSFMYHGEVNVAQEELNSFLSVAEELKVKGLTQGNATESPSNLKTYKNNPTQSSQSKPSAKKPFAEHSSPTPPPKPRQIQLGMSELQQHEDDDIQEVVPVVKQEPEAVDNPVSHPVVSQTQNYQHPFGSQLDTVLTSMDDSYCDAGYEDYEGYGGDYGDSSMMGTSGHDPSKGFFSNHDDTVASLIIHEGINIYTCGRCGKTCNKKDHLKRHIISKHMSTPAVECQFCGKQYKNQNSLQVHISQSHRQL